MSEAAVALTVDETHVLLDALTVTKSMVHFGQADPWEGYQTDPSADPKASREGWLELLRAVEEKLEKLPL